MLRRFLRDTRGLSMTEAIITMPVVMIVVVVMVEAGMATFQWNQTIKALQIGARLASVSTPLVTDEALAELTADYPVDQGGAVPSEIIVVSCGAGADPCRSGALTRLLTGGDGRCGDFQAGATLGVCDFAPFIGARNLRISYTRSGLGYVGRPSGPVVTVRVEAVGLAFDFFILDALLGSGITTIPIPAHPVTITGEDLNDCPGDCSGA